MGREAWKDTHIKHLLCAKHYAVWEFHIFPLIHTDYDAGVIIPILQIRILRFRENKQLSQGQAETLLTQAGLLPGYIVPPHWLLPLLNVCVPSPYFSFSLCYLPVKSVASLSSLVISSAQIFCPDFQPPKQFPVKIPLSLHSISKRSSSPHHSSPSTYTHLGVALFSPVSQTQNHYHFWSFLPFPIFTVTPLPQFFLQNISYLSLFVSTYSLNILELYVCLVPAEASSWFPQCFQSCCSLLPDWSDHLPALSLAGSHTSAIRPSPLPVLHSRLPAFGPMAFPPRAPLQHSPLPQFSKRIAHCKAPYPTPCSFPPLPT